MRIRLVGLLCGGLLLPCLPAVALAAGEKVDVRVEGASRTLVSERTVTLTDAPVVKDGDPSHSCTADSAAAALEAATGGDWTGQWSEGLGYFVQSIRGEKPASASNFFELWIDHRESTTGLCDTKLRPGDSVLLFPQSCVFDSATKGCRNAPVTPLALRTPARASVGQWFTVTIVGYSAAGRARPVRGAVLYASGRRLGTRSDAQGRIRVRGRTRGVLSLHAAAPGRARSEVAVVRIGS